ncbi:MAG: hypothetical protein PW790_01920 [Parvibaculaceae bacterium]|nr:hypothetical protein [Parvibaculaceae bacterium]
MQTPDFADMAAIPASYPMLRKAAPDMSGVDGWQQRRLLNVLPRLSPVPEDQPFGAFQRQVSSGSRASGHYDVPRNVPARNYPSTAISDVDTGLPPIRSGVDKPCQGPLSGLAGGAGPERDASPYAVSRNPPPVAEVPAHTDEEPHYAVPSNRLAPFLWTDDLRPHFLSVNQAQQGAVFEAGSRTALDHLPSARSAGWRDSIETREPLLPLPEVPRERISRFGRLNREIGKGGERVWGSVSTFASRIMSGIAGLPGRFQSGLSRQGVGEVFVSRPSDMSEPSKAETGPSRFQRFTYRAGRLGRQAVDAGLEAVIGIIASVKALGHASKRGLYGAVAFMERAVLAGWRGAKAIARTMGMGLKAILRPFAKLVSILSRRRAAKRDASAGALVRASVRPEQKTTRKSTGAFLQDLTGRISESADNILIGMARRGLVVRDMLRRR